MPSSCPMMLMPPFHAPSIDCVNDCLIETKKVITRRSVNILFIFFKKLDFIKITIRELIKYVKEVSEWYVNKLSEMKTSYA
jgi:hypothetical protein